MLVKTDLTVQGGQKPTGIAGAWMANQEVEAPVADQITRRMC
jgi:hypothetical protein